MNMKKVVAVTLILSSMTAVSASAAEFNDINGLWADDVINVLADKDIKHGVSDTEFNPDGTGTSWSYRHERRLYLPNMDYHHSWLPRTASPD